jgi:hypothetical protein
VIVSITNGDANAIMTDYDFDLWCAACGDCEDSVGHVSNPRAGKAYTHFPLEQFIPVLNLGISRIPNLMPAVTTDWSAVFASLKYVSGRRAGLLVADLPGIAPLIAWRSRVS